MKTLVIAMLLVVAISSCSSNRGRTTMLFPDCDELSAEEQPNSNCMHRP